MSRARALVAVMLILAAARARTDDAAASAPDIAPPSDDAAAGTSPRAAETPRAAPFVGTVHYDVVIQGQDAKARYARSEGGDTVVEVTVRDARIKQSIKTSVVVLSGNPDEAWQIMHQTRTFSRVALVDAPAVDERRFVVTPGQPLIIAGRGTRAVSVVDTVSGDTLDVWLDPTSGDLETLDRLYRGYQPQAPSIAPILARAGHTGLPLRFEFTKKSAGQHVSGNATAIEQGVVDDSALSPPRGFVRIELPPGSGPIPLLSGPPSAKDVHSVIRSFVGQTP